MTPDRKAPRRILLSVPHMGGGERRYVDEAFDQNWMSTAGPNLTALEAEFGRITGEPCVALGSGTAAIHLGLRLMGIGPGDEVVTPTLTFAASTNPIRYEHATPVFMDSDRATWNLDPGLLARFLADRARANRLPKAVMVVHLFGQSADLDPILAECRRYGLPLLEDAAEALGARYGDAVPGTLGDIGVFSFNGNKMITGTTGGLLSCRRKDWADSARKWSTQARDADPLGVNNYVHSELGFNYRMSNVVAGIVRGQLEVLEDRVLARRAVFERYRAGLADVPGFEPQPEPMFGRPGTRHTRWLSCFLVDAGKFGMSAVDLIRRLDSENIESRPVWRPMHTQPIYRAFECVGGDVAEDLNARGICLPSSSSLAAGDQEFVIGSIRRAAGVA